MNSFFDHRFNVFSQNGEDGIISRLLFLISCYDKLNNHCAEFGAWDGIFLSNTFHLVKNHNYRGLYIEANDSRFQTLISNMRHYNTICLHRLVGIQSHNNLDSILSDIGFPVDFDVLSVDIDGCDFYIIQSLKKFRPKVIVVEYNPLIPNEVNFVQRCDFNVNHGSSIMAFQKLALQMSYILIATTETNAILVDAKYVRDEWHIVSDLHQLRPDEGRKIYAFMGFDGTLLFSQDVIKYPWLNLTFHSEDFQAIPSHFRSYNRTIWVKFFFVLYLFLFKRYSLNKISLRSGLQWLFRK